MINKESQSYKIVNKTHTRISSLVGIVYYIRPDCELYQLSPYLYLGHISHKAFVAIAIELIERRMYGFPDSYKEELLLNTIELCKRWIEDLDSVSKDLLYEKGKLCEELSAYSSSGISKHSLISIYTSISYTAYIASHPGYIGSYNSFMDSDHLSGKDICDISEFIINFLKQGRHLFLN